MSKVSEQIEFLENYQAWVAQNKGVPTDISPRAYLVHLASQQALTKLDQIREEVRIWGSSLVEELYGGRELSDDQIAFGGEVIDNIVESVEAILNA